MNKFTLNTSILFKISVYDKIGIMDKMKRKLFLFDIDGTLFDNANNCVPKSTVLALRELRKAHDICIATGRARFMLYSIEEILPLVNYFILINGRYILDGKQVVFEDPMSKPQLSKVVKDLDDLKVTYGFQGIDDEGISNIDADVMKFFEELSMDLPPLNKDYYLEKNVYQAWCFCTEEIAEILRKKHPGLQFVRWLHVGYDILPIGSSKSIGMRKLAEHLKIDVKDIVAFGDGDNDYELIRDAGLGIAMGNGTEKVKAVADYVTESVADDGIFSALKHFGFI